MDIEELTCEVLRLLRRQDVLFFLGAGASAGTQQERAADAGLPLGSELANAIASEFDVDAQGGDLRKTASVAAQRRGTAAVKRFVAEEVSSRSRSPLRAHQALARVRPPLVVTTNYDDLYEKALRELDEHPEKVVHEEDLVHLPRQRPKVVKLHGDAGSPNSLVLTGEDYLDWEANVEGLFVDVTAEFQRSSCVFVGYGLADENLRRVISFVRKRLRRHAPKHYALVHRVDEGTEAEFGDSVQFVEGDATEFLEDLAERWEREDPARIDLRTEEGRFFEAVRGLDFDEGARACERLHREYLRRGATNTAAAMWQELADAAAEAEEKTVAAGAYVEAGRLFHAAGQELLAENALQEAAENARAANMPAKVREAELLLQATQLSRGDYQSTLLETQEALDTLATEVTPEFLYATYRRRASAKEALGDDAGAISELTNALATIPGDRLYLRTDLRCTMARIYAKVFEWARARGQLGVAKRELNQTVGTDGVEKKRSDALVKLVRANIQQGLGKDREAIALYEECEETFQETGDETLLVSAMKGSSYCRQFFGELPTTITRARLRDLLSSSSEYRMISEQRQSGIEAMADQKLAEAHSRLLRVISGAKAVYSPNAERTALTWYAQVLLSAGNVGGALTHYVLAGDSKKSGQTATMIAASPPLMPGALEIFMAGLIKIAGEGSIISRGAAFVALKEMADVMPLALMNGVADLLSGAADLPADAASDRNLLTPAAELAEEAMSLFDDEQALRVGHGLAETIEQRGRWWVSYKASCSALAALARQHPETIEHINVPVKRLVELVRGDVINDLHRALAALVNLALAGHVESDRRAKELLHAQDDVFHVRWRYLLNDVGEEELTRTIQTALPRCISRMREVENGVQWGIGALSPTFLLEFHLPEEVRSEVAQTLIAAVSDPAVFIPDRQAAATVLGNKAQQLNEEGRERAFDALSGLLGAVEIHPALHSITYPISAVRMNIGQPDDIRAAAAESLLALSSWMDGERRTFLRSEIEKLRVGQAETLGRGLATGLRHFRPRGNEELGWLATRLLLLLNAPHPIVRRSATFSLGDLIEQEILLFEAELLDMLLFLGSSARVTDRTGAAYALARVVRNERWTRQEAQDAVETLREDRSRTVRYVSHASALADISAETPNS